MNFWIVLAWIVGIILLIFLAVVAYIVKILVNYLDALEEEDKEIVMMNGVEEVPQIQ